MEIVWISLLGGSVTGCNRCLEEASEHLNARNQVASLASHSIAIERRTHLYSPLATCQTPRLGATLDLLLVPPARQNSLSRLALGRQLVSHRREVLRRVHIHRLALLRVAWVWIVLIHAVLRRGVRRAHLLSLLLLRRLRLAILETYWREVQRWEGHVRDLGGASILLMRRLALGRVGIRGLHRG